MRVSKWIIIVKHLNRGYSVSFLDDVFHRFKFLLELFSSEFVFTPGQAVQVSHTV